MAVNGCWQQLWPESVNNFWGLPSQQDEIRNTVVLSCDGPGEGFADLEEAYSQEVLDSCPAELAEEELELLTVVSELEHECSDVLWRDLS
jgi:hypothetical protein